MSDFDHVDALVRRCRTLELDHEPDGWPAIQMRDVTALCDEIDRLRKLREVVTAYIDATGDVPGNNETWAERFRDAYDA